MSDEWEFIHQFDRPAGETPPTADEIVTAQCPQCDVTIQGIASDIDSGLRKHVDLCFEMYLERLKGLGLAIHCGGCDGSCGGAHEEVRLEEIDD